MKRQGIWTPALAPALILATVALAAAVEVPGTISKDGVATLDANLTKPPAGAREIEVPNGGFESGEEEWKFFGGSVLEDGAPEGSKYARIPEKDGTRLHRSGNLTFTPGATLQIGFDLRCSADTLTAVLMTDSLPRYKGIEIPSTGGEWKRACMLVKMPAGATWVNVAFRHTRGTEGQVDLDDLRVHEVPVSRITRVWEAERAKYPPLVNKPQPEYGKNLPMTVWKFQGGPKGGAERPFLIWAIGSSFTNFLGDGTMLIESARPRFPNMPEVVYKKRATSSQPWDYLIGWAQTLIASEQPDLVLIYTNGQEEKLDRLIREIRSRTSAEVILPTLHMLRKEAEDPQAALEADIVKAIQTVAPKYNCELVNNRHQWLEYLNAYDLEVDGPLLADAVHQSPWGALLINEHIAQHIKPSPMAPPPDQWAEQRVEAEGPGKGKTKVKTSGSWEKAPWKGAGRPASGDGLLVASAKGAAIEVDFTGNRAIVLGARSADGGTASVFIDGKPASDAPAFNVSVPEPNSKNFGNPNTGATGPQGVTLGDGEIVPQDWTISMTDGVGGFEVSGSVTGKDGTGNLMEPFTSKSGQIVLDPALWRRAKMIRDVKHKKRGDWAQDEGDTFTFTVERAAAEQVNFKAEDGQPGLFWTTVVQNLSNGPHTVKLVANGDGPVRIDAFDVFEPPIKP